MIEMIICSAIHVKDGKVHDDQPYNIVIGFTVCGRRHHNCHSTLSILNEELEKTVTREDQGFITNFGKYVDRLEGMVIAKAANQLLYPHLHKGDDDVLTSEDLWVRPGTFAD